MTEAKATAAAKVKENAALQSAVQAGAVAQAQLAAAALDRQKVKASLDALAARDRAAQQETLRVATLAAQQAASQAATQAASQAAAQTAARNKLELAKAIALVNASNKKRTDEVARAAAAAAAAIGESAEGVQQTVSESNHRYELMQAEMALKIEEVKQQGHHDNVLMYLAAFGSFATGAFTFLTNRARRKWSTAVIASRVSQAATTAVVTGNVSVLAAVAEGTASSKDSLAAANHVTQKISDIRADLAEAVRATNAQTAAATLQRADIRQDVAALQEQANPPT